MQFKIELLFFKEAVEINNEKSKSWIGEMSKKINQIVEKEYDGLITNFEITVE